MENKKSTTSPIFILIVVVAIAGVNFQEIGRMGVAVQQSMI